jgi:hypothetical protein
MKQPSDLTEEWSSKRTGLGVTTHRSCVGQYAINSVSSVTHCSKKCSTDCRVFLRAEFNFPALCLRQFCAIDAGGAGSPRLRPACHSPYCPEFLHWLILSATTLSHRKVRAVKSKMVGQKPASHFCRQRSRRDCYEAWRRERKSFSKLRRAVFLLRR